MAWHRVGKNGKKYWGKAGAGIFFTDGRSVLLLKRAEKGDDKNTWGLPGGKAEDGESSIDTARREAKEECGHSEGQRFDKSEEKDNHFRWTTFFFQIKNKFECTLSDEHSDWEWVPFEDLDQYELHPKLAENIDRYLDIINRKFGQSFKEWLHD